MVVRYFHVLACRMSPNYMCVFYCINIVMNKLWIPDSHNCWNRILLFTDPCVFNWSNLLTYSLIFLNYFHLLCSSAYSVQCRHSRSDDVWRKTEAGARSCWQHSLQHWNRWQRECTVYARWRLVRSRWQCSTERTGCQFLFVGVCNCNTLVYSF